MQSCAVFPHIGQECFPILITVSGDPQVVLPFVALNDHASVCYSVPLTGRACDPTDCPWNSPGQNTGVGSRSLLQGIFPSQGSNPGLLHCKQILYQLSHKGSPMFCKSTSNASAKSMLQSFPGGSVVKNLLANAGDMSSTPGLGRCPGEGNGNLLQHSCLGNPTCLADYSPWDCKVVRHDLAMKQQQN